MRKEDGSKPKKEHERLYLLSCRNKTTHLQNEGGVDILIPSC